MTTTRTAALRWTKTRSGRYSALAGGFRYIATKHDDKSWGLSIQRTMTVVDVEIGDPAHRPYWHELESLREAKVIATEFHELDGVDLGIRSRFAVAISQGYDKIIAAL